MALLLTDLVRPSFMLFTIVIYVLLICVLLKGRKSKFSSPFYFLFVSTGVGDVLNLSQRIILTFLPSLFYADEWLSMSNELPLATITSAAQWYISYVQILGLVSISTNRFLAVALPLRFNKIWTLDKLKIILLLQWILPTLLALPMVHPYCQSVYYENDITNAAFENDAVNNVYSIIDMILEALICAPLVIFMSGMAVIISVKNRNHMTNGEIATIRARKSAEQRLAFVGVVISVSYVSSVIFVTLYDFASSQWISLDSGLMATWYFNSFDAFTLSNPYILLFLSSVVRTAFLRFVMCKVDVDVVYSQAMSGVHGPTLNRTGPRRSGPPVQSGSIFSMREARPSWVAGLPNSFPEHIVQNVQSY